MQCKQKSFATWPLRSVDPVVAIALLSAMSLSKLQQKLYKKEKERKKLAGKNTALSAESKAKVLRDQQAHICAICRQTFPVNATCVLLEQHAASKHEGKAVEELFPEIVEMRAAAAAPAKSKGKGGKGKGGKGGAPTKGSAKVDEIPDFLADAGAAAKKKKKKKT